MLRRAYTTFEVKTVDAEERVLDGIASTPSVDRVGDVMDPEGARYALPMPLLWQHRHDEPIGHVLAVTGNKDGLKIRAQIAKGVSPRIDEAWNLIKSGLVRGFSIGFKPVDDEGIAGSYGRRYKTWDWLETSVVTIPANQDATILAVKSADGLAPPPAATGLHTPGVTGAHGARTRVGAPSMKTTREQITAFEAKRGATAQRMTDVMQKAADEGRTLDEQEQQEYDSAQGEVEAIDAHLKRLVTLEKSQVAAATPLAVVDPATGSAARGFSTPIMVKSNVPAGIGMARYAMCAVLAYKHHQPVAQIAKEKYPDYSELHDYISKAAVPAGTTSDAVWASPLVYQTNLASEFIEFLRPLTIIGKFGTGGIPSLRRVPFNIRVVGQTTGGAGYWVGQGAPKPLTSFEFAASTLLWTKVAAIAVITEELARFSSPSAEMLVRDSLAAALIERIDIDFIDPAHSAAAGVSPASITNGVAPIASSGSTAADIRADIAALIDSFLAGNVDPTSLVLIMSNSLALSLSLMVNPLGQPEFPGISMRGGSLQGIPVIASQYAANLGASGNVVIACNASDIFLADDGGVTLDASREATIQMLTDPTMNSGLATPTTGVSMFQTNSIALRAERFINWAKRRAEAAAFLDNVSWGAPTGSP